MNTQLTFNRDGRMRGLELQKPMTNSAPMNSILRRAMERQASDVHLVVGLPPMLRIDGELIAGEEAPLGRDDVRELIYSLLTEGQLEEFERDWQLCVSLFLPDVGHFRVTVYYHMSNVEAS